MTYRPHILFLSQCLPYPPSSGVTNRTFNILLQLGKEFEVTLLAFSRVNHQPDADARNASWEALRDHVTSASPPVPIPSEQSTVRRLWDHLRSVSTGRAYTFYEYESKDFRVLLRGALSHRRFDLIHIDSLDLYRWLDELLLVPTACTHHSIESELLRLRAQRVKSRVMRRYLLYQATRVEQVERELCPQFSMNVMMSEVDAERLRTLAPGSKAIVVPNAVDTNYLRPQESQPGVPGRVVFLGPTYMFPNRDAVDYFIEDIWPDVRALERSASLHLIGNTLQSYREGYNNNPGVTCLGYVADIRPHLAQASCTVVPIRVGGGTRLKILDAWAMGKAVVSTSMGCEGLEAIDGKNILIRDDPKDFAGAVAEVLANSELRSELGVNGRKTAEEMYSWDIVGRTVRVSYRHLLQGA